jgi:glycosidase
MYQIFIDRFAGYDPAIDWHTPEFMGGSLRGIIDKFDYIQDLGVNTVWLSPFCKTSAFHGYEVTDFMKVDPRFGTEKDLKELIALCHKNGMKIIADIVPNHVSAQHPFFIDAKTNPASPYRNWFFFKAWPDQHVGFQTFGNMAKLNLDNQQVREHILASARKWLDMGLDGYRIDHVIGLSNQNVQDVFGVLQKEYPGKVFFGEAAMFGLGGDPASTRASSKGLHTVRIPKKTLIWALKDRGLNLMIRNYTQLLDGMLDFYFAHHIVRYARATSDVERAFIKKKLQQHVAKYPNHFSLVFFLDNHDLTRYLYHAKGDKQKLLDAAGVMFSLDGAKVIYYGTEVGVTQDLSFMDSGEIHDIQARKPMPWNVADQDIQLLESFKKLIK